MKSFVAAELNRPLASPWGGRVVVGWLKALFHYSTKAPWLIKLLKWPVAWMTMASSPLVRRGTAANARRILQREVSSVEAWMFGCRAVVRFVEFVLSVGTSASSTVEGLRARIESVHGREGYDARRAQGGGAIIVSAHMGSFELGLASLAEVESNIHVVFKRDMFEGFEQSRRMLRETLGIHETPIDDGWNTWLGLRDALHNNHVIILHGDRAMPGQKSETVPFLGGHLRMPSGPIKLALASGAPIIPIFAVMTRGMRCKLFIEPAIEVTSDNAHESQLKLAETIARFVKAYPEQWLVLTPAFVEEESGSEAHR